MCEAFIKFSIFFFFFFDAKLMSKKKKKGGGGPKLFGGGGKKWNDMHSFLCTTNNLVSSSNFLEFKPFLIFCQSIKLKCSKYSEQNS